MRSEDGPRLAPGEVEIPGIGASNSSLHEKIAMNESDMNEENNSLWENLTPLDISIFLAILSMVIGAIVYSLLKIQNFNSEASKQKKQKEIE
jgi:hypothetical protein